MPRRPVTALLVVPLVLAGCGADEPDASTGGTITVFAAASLTDAMEDIGEAFERANPGVTVEFNFAGSSALREQILAGAPADVFASANRSNMDALVADGAVNGTPRPVVSNRLQIAVPAGNPADVTGLADFADPDLLIGLCAEEVPCGEFALEALASAGVEPSVDTYEPDVRSLLTKIEEGEVDAGLVYRSDVLAGGGRVEGIEIPDEHNVVAEYPIAVLEASDDADIASAFVTHVLSPGVAEIFERYGFDPA